MSNFTIDVDAEAVFLDGGWYTREDLSRRIKAMLDQSDFRIAEPSAALQELTQTLASVRTLQFRCTPELADSLEQLAVRMGQSVGYLLREALTQFITDATSAPPPSPVKPPPQATGGTSVTPAFTPEHRDLAPARESLSREVVPVAREVPVGRAPTVPAMPVPVAHEPRQAASPPATSSTQDDLPKVIVEEAPPVVIAGPGALRAAGVKNEGDKPRGTGTHARQGEEGNPISSEHRWFKQ